MAVPPYSKTCDRTYYPAYRKSGYRPESEIIWIVLHDTESPADSADGVAAYFKSHSAQGSAHLVIDGDDCHRVLLNTDIPWGAPGANTKGFHIEMVGRAKWTRAQWLAQDDELNRVAYKVALHAKRWNLPLYFRRAYGLKRGYRGITTHSECTKAFGGSHTDPGSNFPMDVLLQKAKKYRAKM